jgi:hypothetical protein
MIGYPIIFYIPPQLTFDLYEAAHQIAGIQLLSQLAESPNLNTYAGCIPITNRGNVFLLVKNQHITSLHGLVFCMPWALLSNFSFEQYTIGEWGFL